MKDIRIEVRAKGTVPVPPQVRVTGDLTDTTYRVREGSVLFDSVHASNVDFSGSTFWHFIANGSMFSDCSFDRVRMSGTLSGSTQSVFRRCSFKRAHLRNAFPGQARFEECQFDHANIKGWRSTRAEFVGCTFAGRIEDVMFFGRPWAPEAERVRPPRSINEFRGNDFRLSDLRDFSLVDGIQIEAQLWPTGPQYIMLDRIKERIHLVRAQVAKWPDAKAREAALLMLRVQEEVRREQDTLFARRDDIDVVPARIRDRVWALLKEAPLPGEPA